MIRRAEAKDLESINKLLQQVLLVHHEGRPDIFKEKGKKYTDEELLKLFSDDNNPVFVYEDESGAVIGHCFCQTQDSPESPNTYAHKSMFIDDLCIDENARGKSVGRTMYEFVKNYAKENGFDSVTLHAWECNEKAVGFYKHLGMKVKTYTFEETL